MIRANDLLRGVVDEFGTLRGIAGSFELQDELMDESGCDEFIFEFDSGMLVVSAVPDDDTIRLHGSDSGFVNRVDLTRDQSWARLVGCEVDWIWTLQNQQGYIDGVQMEFSRPGEGWGLQLMCEASRLRPRSVGRLELLSNYRA
jgi:hypothetical protein